MAIKTAAGIAGGQLLSMLVEWGKGKHDDKKRRERVCNIFHAAFTDLDNRDPRIGILCDKSTAFRNEMFSFAKGESFDFDGMFKEARAYQTGEGGENFSPERIGKAFFDFSQCLRQQCKNHGVTTVGELDIDFDAFDRYVSHIYLGGRGGQADPTEAKQTLPPVYIPHRPNPLLRHYQSWLKQIEDALRTGAAVVNQFDVSQGVALHGQGGLGKTAMAVEYAHRYKDRYPGGVFWLQADLGLGQASAEVATNLGWPLPDEATDQQIIATVLPRLRTQEPKLVILDNLDDKVVPKEIVALPASQLLVTTRLSDVSVGQPVTMGLPTEEEALGIFLAYAESEGKDLSQAEQDAAYAICRRSGFLPVALEILGKNARKVPLVDLAKAMDQAVSQKSTVGTKGQELTIAAALAVTSHNYSHPRAKEALLHLAYFYPEELDKELLALVIFAGTGEDAPEQALDEAQAMLAALADFSVVQPKPGGGYATHRLVQDAARLEDRDQKAGERVVQVLDTVIHHIAKLGIYKEGLPYFPHLMHIGELWISDVLQCFNDCDSISRWAMFLTDSGRYKYSEKLQRIALYRAQVAKGPNSPAYAFHLNNLAITLKMQGKWTEAERLYRQVLELDKTNLGDQSQACASTYNNLAMVLRERGQLSEAESLLRLAIEIGDKAPTQKNSYLATRLNNLAAVLLDCKKYDEAEKLIRKAMELDKNIFGEDNPDYSTDLHNLAYALQCQGRYSEAEKLFCQCLAIDEKTIGKSHPNYAYKLNNLAKVLRDQGRLKEAIIPLSQALDIFLDTLGPEHPYTSRIQKNLDSLLSEIKSRT